MPTASCTGLCSNATAGRARSVARDVVLKFTTSNSAVAEERTATRISSAYAPSATGSFMTAHEQVSVGCGYLHGLDRCTAYPNWVLVRRSLRLAEVAGSPAFRVSSQFRTPQP